MRRRIERQAAADVIALSAHAARAARRRLDTERDGGAATILLFTGVRYERMLEAASAAIGADEPVRVEQSA